MKKYIESSLWQFSAIKYLLCALVVIVPLYVSKAHLFSFTTPKGLLLIAIAILLVGFYLWIRVKEQNVILALTWVHGVLALFVSILVTSGIFGIVPHHAFFGDMTGMGINVICASAVVAGILGYVIRKEQSFITTLMTWSLLVSVLMVIILYGGEKLLPSSTDGSTLGNTSYLGAYLLVNVCFALGLFITQKGLWKRIMIALGGLFILTSPILFNKDIFKGLVSVGDIAVNPLLLSGSANGAVMGLGVAVFSIGALFLIRSQKKVLQWFGAIGLVGLFLGVYVAGQVLMDPSSSLHQSYVAEKNTNRFLFWDIASQSAREHLLLGTGMNSYSYMFQEHFSPTFFSPGYYPELWTENPHNMFREYQVSTGIVGLIAYLLLIGTTGIVLFIGSRSEDKMKKVVSIVLFGALFGYVLQNLFVFDTAVPLLMFYLIIGYAISVGNIRTITIPSEYKTYKLVGSSIIILSLMYAFSITVVKPWQESKVWANYTAKNKISKEDTPQTISLVGYTGDTAYLADKVLEFFKDNYDDKNSSQKEKDYFIKTFQVAIKNGEEDMLRDERENFRAHWTIGQMYVAIMSITRKTDDDLIQKAQTHLQEAISINPNNPLVYYDIVQVYALKKDYDKTRAWSRAAIALNPEYRGGYLLADRLVKAGLDTKEFSDYVTTMRDKWCQKDSLCSTGKWK